MKGRALLDRFTKAEAALCDYFGYKHDWRIFPIVDETRWFWRINDGTAVEFSETAERLEGGPGGEDTKEASFYSNEIFTYRHLTQYVYRRDDLTMVLVNTHTDGNIWLTVLDNKKERPTTT